MKIKELIKQKKILLAFVCGAAVGACGMAAVLGNFGVNLFSQVGERRVQDQALAPLIEEARSWSLDYDNVAKGASADVGKAVVWCIDHPTAGSSYVGDNASWVIQWTNEDLVPIVGGKHGCQDMVAVVRGSDARGVSLEFKGQP